MQIFHPQSHPLHAPAWYLADGAIRPCPETPARAHVLLDALQSHHQLTLIPAPDLAAPLPAAFTKIHTPDYLHYLQTIHPRWHQQFHTDVLPDTFPRTNSPHPKNPANPQPADYCFDLAAPITAGTWQAALNAAYCALAAANAILPSDHRPLTTGHSSSSAPTAYALTRPPGHHAGPDYAGGFCYLNHVALAAQHLLDAGQKKVAILDLDYHHGNGTQDIFYHRQDVLFISLHADPNTQYPYFWGHPEETGAAEGQGFNLNLPLPRNASSALWFTALDTALDTLKKFRPDSLLISLGADIHTLDTVGDFQLTTPDFAKIAQKLRPLNLPTAFIQEGGYNLQILPSAITTLLNNFNP